MRGSAESSFTFPASSLSCSRLARVRYPAQHRALFRFPGSAFFSDLWIQLSGGTAMQRFVVGSGRCGSTLLSRMLDESPDTLNLFEFFNGLDLAERFDPHPIPGSALAELIAREQPFVTAVLRRGYPVEEITYPFADGDASALFRGKRKRADPLPWVLVSTLPRLDSKPDSLFDRMMEFVGSLPEQPPREHYLALFAWLCSRFDRRFWIERSGSSIDYVADLIHLFPAARFVHIHRSGPEVALSMREHHAYRLPITLLYDAPLGEGKRVSELAPLDLDGIPNPRDTISQILESRPPAEFFGRYWSDQILHGKPALAELPREQLLEISFEDLVEDPRHVLGAVADFLEIHPGRGEENWLVRAAALSRGRPPQRLPLLARDERERLLKACESGSRLIGRA